MSRSKYSRTNQGRYNVNTREDIVVKSNDV